METTTPTTQTPDIDSLPPYCDFQTFETIKVHCTQPERKQIPQPPPQPGQQPQAPSYYNQIPLLYNFGSNESPVLRDFLLEGPELESPTGVSSKPTPNNPTRMDHTIMVRLPIDSRDAVHFMNTVNQVHAALAYILHQYKGAVKLPNFNKDMAEATGLRNPIYIARDEVTGEPIPGRNPSMYFKLFKRGSGMMEEKTLFTNLKGQPISWDLLHNVEMKFIPLLHIEKIYVGGGKASMQMKMVSAIVTSLRARNSVTRQLYTIDRLTRDNPNRVDALEAQIAKLTMDRQGSLVTSSTVAADPQVAAGDQTTFAGIGGRTTTPMSYIPTATQPPAYHGGHGSDIPSIPPVPGISDMSKFLSNAPAQNPYNSMGMIPDPPRSPGTSISQYR